LGKTKELFVLENRQGWWDEQSACLSAIFDQHSIDPGNYNEKEYFLNVFPDYVEFRYHDKSLYGYGSTWSEEDRWCPGKIDTYQSPMDAIQDQRVNYSTRGKITGMSKKSGLRLKKKISRSQEALKLFQTLTYPDEVMAGKTLEERIRFSSNHFHNFSRRVQRMGFKGIWRKELKGRSWRSRFLAGEIVPHYHIVFSGLGLSELTFRADAVRIAKAWVDTMGIEDPVVYAKTLAVNTHYEGSKTQNHKANNAFDWITDEKMLSRYVTKYISKAQKVDVDENISLGRMWGVIGKIPEAAPVVIRLTESIQKKVVSIFRRFYKHTAPRPKDERYRKKQQNYLRYHDTNSFIFCSVETVKRVLLYLEREAFKNPLEQTFVDVPF
jgi:hypothetical protein